ncbi:MAG: isochorismatase family protein [Deltaproteobacteria bacterium]|nr:isochorismatase family protein [Deltaproteobacteria bacterium]
MVNSFEDHCWSDVVSQEMLDIYNAYQRRTYIGDKPALLVVDLYNLVYEGGARPVHEAIKAFPGSAGVNAWNAMEPTQELLALARKSGIPVIYTTTETREELKPKEVYATNRQMRDFDREAFLIRKEFEPEPGDLIIYKQRASAFFGTPLIAHLRKLGVDTVIVCGESTSGCVRASVVDCYSYGFHTVVVEECCFDRSVLIHKLFLFDLHHKYADVLHLDEVKSRLQALR